MVFLFILERRRSKLITLCATRVAFTRDDAVCVARMRAYQETSNTREPVTVRFVSLADAFITADERVKWFPHKHQSPRAPWFTPSKACLTQFPQQELPYDGDTPRVLARRRRIELADYIERARAEALALPIAERKTPTGRDRRRPLNNAGTKRLVSNARVDPTTAWSK